jgi:2-iminoacetate synthase
VSDERSPVQVASVIQMQGMEVIWQESSPQHWHNIPISQ